MKKQKQKFRLSTLIAVESLIILVAIVLNIYKLKIEPVWAITYENCVLESVQCPNEPIPYYPPETVLKTKIYNDKQYSVAEVKQIIAVISSQEDFDDKLLQNIARCESGWIYNKRGKVDPRDRGTFQINSRWNPSVSDEQADNPWFATRWTINEIKEGRLWKWQASEYCWKT